MPSQSISIPLTQGKVAIIDAGDYERVSRFKWHAWKNEGTWYAGRTVNEPRTEYLKPGKNHKVLLHRFLMDALPNEEVDHINGDGLDNRRSTNLRRCTHKNNSRNGRLSTNNTSGYKGVVKSRSAWRANIKYEGKSVNVGTFSTAIDAALAYDAKARELFGEFANLNFPD